MSYVAKAISRAELRNLAAELRTMIGFGNKPYFPVVEFMEYVMPSIFPDFNYEIVRDDELPGIEGLTLPHENLIRLPNTVYCEAVEGKGRARFSIAHEISHFILIDDENIALARSGHSVPAYQQPEWRANTLASELLMVPKLSIGMNREDVAMAFGVSLSAARVHLKVKSNERLP